MSNIPLIITNSRSNSLESNHGLAEAITRAASKQTYYTIRFLVDRDRVEDAYRAYAYFRWMDDQIDQSGMTKRERLSFAKRQQALIERCYRGEAPRRTSDEESMLVQLIRSDREESSGLQSYIRNMMAVMAFDAERRGRLISQGELDEYTRGLAVAVAEAMHYFIGRGRRSPRDETRYQAVTAAHITHMLRDTLDDLEAGYFNIPREVLESHHMHPGDVHSQPYRKWVEERVGLARACFESGRSYFARVENARFRAAGFAYTARFESVLSAIERDDYHLRSGYPECKSWPSAIRMGWSALWQAFIPQP